MPQNWILNTNIYEVNLRQYTREGTINAFLKELPRLKDMGVETLWFMPLTPISIEKRKGLLGSYYACSDYMAINTEFGIAEDFKILVQQAHQMQMKVIIDWVANHTGYDHVWTKTHPEFYKKNEKGEFYDAHGWEDVIDLNYDSWLLREAMINAMLYWVNEFDIDGFRCDMAMLVPLSFWQETRVRLDQHKKLFWLAECEDPAYHEVFDATYSWRILHAMEEYYKNNNSDNFINVLNKEIKNFPTNAIRLLFTSNHDENSHSGSEYERMGDIAKCFAVFTCTWNGIPLIYSGQEAANTKRLSFFDKDCIDWSKGYVLHNFYKSLLLLRKSNPALLSGNDSITIFPLSTDNNKIFTFLRKNQEREVLVILNLSGDYFWMHLLDERVEGVFKDVLLKTENNLSQDRYFEMHPWNFIIYEK